MEHSRHNGLALLLSLGAVTIAGCSLDVGDALTSALSTAGDDSGEGDGDGEGEGDGEETGEDDTGGGDGDDDGGPVGTTASPTGGGDDDEGGDEGEGDTSGGFDPTQGDDAGEVGGDPSGVCGSFDVHVEECGFGAGAGEICQYDLDYFAGSDCAAAVEEYYACLSTTDCDTLATDDPAVCGGDQLLEQCAE